MKTSKHDDAGKLKNGVFKDHYEDDTLACVGEFASNQKVGEWRVYDAKRKLIKTTKHTSPQEKP